MSKYLITVYLFFGFASYAFSQSAIEKSGDVLAFGLPAVTGVSTLILQGNDHGEMRFALALITTTDLTFNLKFAINKERPNGKNYAFPSGHTSMAFTSAAFAQERYGWKIGVPAYVLAGFTGWTRVHSKNHDWADVIAGAVIGTASGYIFSKPLDGNVQPQLLWNGRQLQTGFVFRF